MENKMTKDELLNIPPNYKIDELIASYVFEESSPQLFLPVWDERNKNSAWQYTGGYVPSIEPKHFSADILFGWDVHKKACSWIFSKRQKYFKNLQMFVSNRKTTDFLIAWPDILIYLEPIDICRAALFTIFE